jgi:hypothetical protein
MPGGYDTDTVVRIETNLDDCAPELIGAVFERLLAAGALDVWITPIQMKKQRPGVMLSLLCEEAKATAMADILFAGTTAFGLRQDRITRLKLARRIEKVGTPFGEVELKIGSRGDEVLQVAPEYESCRAIAEQTGAPLKQIYEAAVQAWRTSSRK